MVAEGKKDLLFKAKVIALIGMYFGDAAANLYRTSYETLPIEFVEKSSEKLLTEYLGLERARSLIHELKEQQA